MFSFHFISYFCCFMLSREQHGFASRSLCPFGARCQCAQRPHLLLRLPPLKHFHRFLGSPDEGNLLKQADNKAIRCSNNLESGDRVHRRAGTIASSSTDRLFRSFPFVVKPLLLRACGSSFVGDSLRMCQTDPRTSRRSSDWLRARWSMESRPSARSTSFACNSRSSRANTKNKCKTLTH